MSKKNKPDLGGFVYSTDPHFNFQQPGERPAETAAPAAQKLRVKLDTKQRAGKAVTLVEGFIGTEDDLQDLGKKLKNFCGTGGSAKNGEIIVQGDQHEKVMQYLLKNGFKNTKKLG